ncbi:hypothetical protein C8Q76DRAFT_689554 [Earliella scabrosa]|nr:hypothetical protein C8Q76DRAFT_689554 [Earliella scabrosa]
MSICRIIQNYCAVATTDRVFFILMILPSNLTDQTCGGIMHADDVFVILNYLSFAAFTILRVYGVWGRDWKPLLLIIPLTLIKPIIYAIESANYIPAQAGPLIGCVYNMTVSDLFVAQLSTASKAATIAADAILIVLTWIKTYGIHKVSAQLEIRTPLATLLLRDGTAYFIILLSIQVVIIVSRQNGSQTSIWIFWSYFDQTFTVIFLSRFMLNLRGLYFSDSNGSRGEGLTSRQAISNLCFTRSFVVGNLGALLSLPSFETHSLDSPSSPTHTPQSSDFEANSTSSTD